MPLNSNSNTSNINSQYYPSVDSYQETTPLYYTPSAYQNLEPQQNQRQNQAPQNSQPVPSLRPEDPIHGFHNGQPQRQQCKSKSGICQLCLFLFGIIVLGISIFFLATFIIGLTKSRGGFLDQSECRSLSRMKNPFYTSAKKSFSGIKKVQVTIPQTRFRPHHIIYIEKGKYDDVSVKSNVYVLSKSNAMDLYFDFIRSGDILQIQYKGVLSNKGCATVELELFLPSKVELEEITLVLPTSSSIKANGIKANIVNIRTNDNFESPLSHFNVTHSEIKQLQVNTTSTVNLNSHYCTSNSGSIKLSGNILQGSSINNCQKIETNGRIVDFSKISLNDGSITASTKNEKDSIKFDILTGLKTFNGQSTFGNIEVTLNGPYTVSTLFDLVTEKGMAQMSVFLGTYNYFRNTVNKKQGKLNCINECPMEVNMRSVGGNLVLKNKN